MKSSNERTTGCDPAIVRGMTRRRFLQMLATGSLTLTGGAVLSACGGAPAPPNQGANAPTSTASPSAAAPTSPPAAQSVDVRLLTAGWPLEAMPSPEDQSADPAKKVYAEVLQEWMNNHPGVTIASSELNIWDQQALVTAISGGVGPSWFPGYVLGNWNVGATRAAFSQGLAAEIQSLVEQYQTETKLADYVQPHLDFLKYNDTFYGVPESYGAGNGVYFRRDMIEAKGLKEPEPGWTWPDFYELAKGLTGDGIKGDAVRADLRNLQFWYDHHLLAVPQQPWESLKIGGGTPPVLTPLGWMTIFHGVDGTLTPGTDHQRNVRYCAGVLILDRDDPRTVRYRSPTPILEPGTDEELKGIVDNVVFPTAVDPRADGRIDVYYGMADARIGVARMQVPSQLP